MTELTFVEAINQALREEMLRDPSVFLIGQDIRNGYGEESSGPPRTCTPSSAMSV